MRVFIKRIVEAALCRSGVTRLSRRRRTSDTIVLAYHNVVPDGHAASGDRSLHMPQREFARQLDLIRRTHDIVPLESLLEPAPVRPRRPRAVITFDDACQGAVTAGVEELVQRQMPATVFVPPAFLGGRSFWWDALSRSHDGGLPDEVRRYALDELAGRDADVRRWAEEASIPMHRVPEHQTCATEAQLHALDRTEGITLASHTWSHPNLARLPVPDLEEELVRPLSWLRTHFRNVLPWITYPYGLASDQVVAVAEAVGYDGALMVDGGWLVRSSLDHARTFALPRQNVPAGMSLHGFELRVSGIVST